MVTEHWIIQIIVCIFPFNGITVTWEVWGHLLGWKNVLYKINCDICSNVWSCTTYHPILAWSSTEAEYRSLALATTEVYWIQSVNWAGCASYLSRQLLWQHEHCTTSLTHNLVLHATNSKHIELNLYFVLETATGSYPCNWSVCWNSHQSSFSYALWSREVEAQCVWSCSFTSFSTNLSLRGSIRVSFSWISLVFRSLIYKLLL